MTFPAVKHIHLKADDLTGPNIRTECKKRYENQGVAIKQWQGHSWQWCTFIKTV